jgi:glycine/D-amino acid oxidase-like deaminating enzyme
MPFLWPKPFSFICAMEKRVLIVGQGLCGSWLSYWLQQAGVDFIVIDEERAQTSTRVASGVINPVTGRRMATTWLADEVIPFAERAYNAMGDFLTAQLVNPSSPSGTPVRLISPCQIIDFFASPDRREAFIKKAAALSQYLTMPADDSQFLPHFHYELGFGIVAPAYQVHLQAMLGGWRGYLAGSGRLIGSKFEREQLKIHGTGVSYQSQHYSHIVFADGVEAAHAGYFQLLPFAPNKGEALLVKIPHLPTPFIFKKGIAITPWQNDLFWVGSSYQHQFADPWPTTPFRLQTEAWLRHFVKHEVTIVDHLASVRPAALERRPFVGWHPFFPQVGLLNGTGTKGVTMAPFFAKQLVDNLINGTQILPEVNVEKHARILARSINN